MHAAGLLSVSEKLAVLHATDTSVDKAVPHKLLGCYLTHSYTNQLNTIYQFKEEYKLASHNTNYPVIGCTTSVMIDY